MNGKKDQNQDPGDSDRTEPRKIPSNDVPGKRSHVGILRKSIEDPLKRKARDAKVVGLAEGIRRAMEPSTLESLEGSSKIAYKRSRHMGQLDDDEEYARSKVERRPLVLFLVGYYTALKIFLYYLISLSSILACGLSTGLTLYWYERFQASESEGSNSSGMDWVLLGFAVVTPLSLSVGIAFRRRERALVEIAKFRSFSFQLYLSHSLWDWDGKDRKSIEWVQHSDKVLQQLVAIGDEMCRFLTLPTTSRSRHRVTKGGRHEAARTAEVAYRLYDSLYTSRMIKLASLSEDIKRSGLPSGEVSRIRQYERFMGEAIENLRMVKTYRTPQTLRSFARLFTTLMPPFFAPTYAQLALNLNSLPMGITFALITSLCLNALLEGVEILEDPFVAFVTLDGIDVREEFQVLHWQQLMNARQDIFPKALPYGYYSEKKIDSGEINAADMVTSTLPDETPSEIPLGFGSESTRGSQKKLIHRPRTRHQKILSFGDDNILSRLEEGIYPSVEGMEFFRESGYQLCGRSRADSDANSLSRSTK